MPYRLSQHDRKVLKNTQLLLRRGDTEGALKDIRYLLGVDDVRQEMIKESEKFIREARQQADN